MITKKKMYMKVPFKLIEASLSSVRDYLEQCLVCSIPHNSAVKNSCWTRLLCVTSIA